ncbi:sensor domain-containing diguanylate cyclase [Pseudodesulfovibrio sp.]|uniref:sensor domain-containing diguanylate cyclase n=1 Tax=unclassified Pseudodesulfovibrio TaxID=2661612 RepID=UPI003AFF9F3B
MNVKFKLLTALSLILLTAFIATSLINYRVTRESVREELLNSALPLTGKNIYSEIHSALMRPILVSSSMANDAFLKEWVVNGEQDIDQLTQYLKQLKDKYGFLTTFFVSAASDKYYYQGGLLKRVNPRDSHDVWYYSFLRKKTEYELDVDTNQTENNKLTIFINFRVEDQNGKLLGVTGVGVNMDKAAELLREAQKRYHRNVYLVDQDGLVQVHQNTTLVKRRYITETPGIMNVADNILKNLKGSVNFEYDHEGEHYLLSTHYIPEFSWHLIVEQEEAAALITARNNLIRTIVIGLIASVLIIILCGFTVSYFQCRLERMAKSDPLTGAANRRALEERFKLASYKADRYGEPFSIILIDLDEFKKINDKYGHLEGDKVLKNVSICIEQTIRPSDLLSRWGGDEFLILMDGKSQEAETLATRIREALNNIERTPISFSCGIAEYRQGEDIDALSRRADLSMYQAKNNDSQWMEVD